MGVLLILVGVISFGLGRQSVVTTLVSQQSAGIVLTESEFSNEVFPVVTTESSAKLVVSRSGTKYHLLNCPGASQIKEENKVYFDSKEQAAAAGYSPAANCPGL